MYFSHHIIIKCLGFKPIHYVINLDVTSSFRDFREFDYVFLLNVLLI